MARRLVSALAALMVASATAGPAAACNGNRECYEKVRAPDLYRTVERPVVVAPGRRVVVPVPAVTVDRVERVEVRPAAVQVLHVPAVYGSALRRELVAPARVTYRETPAIVRTVHETVVVRPGGTRWEHSRGPHGEVRKCKVHVAPITRTIARKAVVAPASRIPVVHPAIYRDVARPVVLREAATRTVYVPPVHQYMNRTLVLRPATSRVIEHPPVIRSERRQELVRHGGYVWQPVR